MFLTQLPQLVGRIFFCCFGIFCFVCIVLPFFGIFLIFLLSPVLSGLFSQVVLLCFFFWFFFLIPTYFSFLFIFACFRSFLVCVSSRIFHPSFDFSFMLLKGTPVSTDTKYSPAGISSFNLLIFSLINMLVLDFFFRFRLDCSPFYIS